MSKIRSNTQLTRDFFLMRVEHSAGGRMGQFYMLRGWDRYPVLSRPISIFDADGETVSFLYKVVGEGTQIFSRLREGDGVTLLGPYGNTFPEVFGTVALVGGGVGIAPLYLAARELKQMNPATVVDVYLGFSDQAMLETEYRAVSDRVAVNVGGLITDEIAPGEYDHIISCGPEVMMRALYQKCLGAGVGDRLVVSMENRMACGIGACLVCSCRTAPGNRKVCKDGPVFLGEEVFLL